MGEKRAWREEGKAEGKGKERKRGLGKWRGGQGEEVGREIRKANVVKCQNVGNLSKGM